MMYKDTKARVIDLSSDDEEEYEEPGVACSRSRDDGKPIKEEPNRVDEPHTNGFAKDSIAFEKQCVANRDLPSRTFEASPRASTLRSPAQKHISRHFWKAGDYEVQESSVRTFQDGMDHVRVHPKFLHTNATSHKWALGAIAELLDNAIDEVQNGATFVTIDKVTNPSDNSPALLIHDDGGGMDPDSIRQCMSLGYSRKTTNTTIGQYGNGFKTSTMRLGADAIVFTSCSHNSRVTQSVGLLSYTFLRAVGHEDIVVPMIDFEFSPKDGKRKMLLRSTKDDWLHNFATLLEWSPYTTEDELLREFADIGCHGTKVIVYNLWLNDDGEPELDFDSDKQDIQLQGAPSSKPDKSDMLQRQLTNQHVATRLRYSLRSYSSILYLQMPPNFQIILRGKVVEHLSIANDLKFPERILYKPQIGGRDGTKEVAVITTIGFAKEAPMINVHGFNVYHKNRLIMPFWKVFHENSSRGKGVIGVLEANFIEPAHDKQDFERTPILQRLESRLKQMTIEYWNLHCELIGYQCPRQSSKSRPAMNNNSSPASFPFQPAPSTPPQPGSDAGVLNNHLEPPHLDASFNDNKKESTGNFGQENMLLKRSAAEAISSDVTAASKRQGITRISTSDTSHQESIVGTQNGVKNKSVSHLLEDIEQLRHRCSQHECREKELENKVSCLEAEVRDIRSKYVQLLNEHNQLKQPKKEI